MASRPKSPRLLYLAWLAAVALVAFALTSRCARGDLELTRPAAAAGSFYPAAEGELRRAVAGYLDQARPDVPSELRGQRPRALIVPHAGYTYSARTAAQCYKLLQGAPRPSPVVLMGPSHYTHMLGACSVADYTEYRTPLGTLTLDENACRKLAEHEPFHRTRLPHQREHCLEVQLPFIQVLWPDAPPIVPILVGQLDAEESRRAAAALSLIMDEDALLIVSTDFTHYGARFGFRPFGAADGEELRDRIRALDMEGVRHIEARDPEAFREYLGRTGATICGRMAVGTALELFSRSASCRPVFLQWANSGAVTGRYTDCVSYVAMAVYAPPEALEEIRGSLSPQPLGAAPQAPDAAGGPPTLGAEQKRALLALARRSVAEAAERQAPQDGPPDEMDRLPEALHARCGAFVTLKRDGRLRGCIGRIMPEQPLCRCVWDVAALAAVRDRRFAPVSTSEVDALSIEISVLEPPLKVGDTEEIEVGRDGLIVSKGRHSGILLPQVATANGWNRAQFLDNTCLKAGLPRDAWRSGDVTILRFTAQVFGEQESGLH